MTALDIIAVACGVGFLAALAVLGIAYLIEIGWRHK